MKTFLCSNTAVRRAGNAGAQEKVGLQFKRSPSKSFQIDQVHANPHTMAGGTSTFYVARRIQDNQLVMVNVLPMQHTLCELLGTRNTVHPYIVAFTEYYEECGSVKWLVLDHMRGDWLNNVIARHSLEEDHVACIAADVCAGLSFLHSLGHILRAVKTDGIFLTREGKAIICDLQNVIKLDYGLHKDTSTLKLVAPHWMPPEVARGKYYTIQTDTWSLGIMIIEMIDKVPPHFQKATNDVLRRIAEDPSPALNKPSRGSSAKLHDFLKKCLYLEQQKRPLAKDLLRHEFLLLGCPHSSIIRLLRHKFRPASLDSDGPKDLTGLVTRSSRFAAVHGGFSDVWMGTYSVSGHVEDTKSITPVAIKVLRSATPDPEKHRKIQKRLYRELSVWNILRHPNVAELYGICTDMSPYSAMVSPWYRKGSAPQFLKSLGDDATLYVRLRLLTDVAAGLEYLHRFTPTVVHGDIKGANILISDDDSACLCDFGLSAIVGEVAGSSNFTSTFAGSLRWTAPELMRPSEPSEEWAPVTTWSDIYALGSVTYELLTGLVPYHTLRNDVQVMFDVIKGLKPVRPSSAESAVSISDTHWNFIESCWKDDPLERPPISIASPRLENMYCEAQPSWHMPATKRRERGSNSRLSLLHA